jgi:hypothetical protein
LLFVALLLAFVGGLEFTYAEYMATRFWYLGYDYFEPDRAWMLATIVVLLVVALFLPTRSSRLPGFTAWFLYAALIVPITTIPLYASDRPPADTFVMSLYYAVVWIAVSLALRRPSLELVPLIRGADVPFWALIVVFSLTTYVLINIAFGISLNLVSVFDVYSTRLEYRDEVIPTIPLLGYLVAGQGYIVNPLLMAMGASRGRWLLAAVGALGQLVLYSTAGYKTVLLSIPVVIGASLLMRHRKTLAGLTVFASITALVWLSIVLDRVLAIGVIDILVSRVFLTAGYLQVLYLRAYDAKPWALWDYSFLGPFVETEYTQSPGFFVASTTLGRPDIQLNAGLFADGYANAGLLGIAIEAAVLVVVVVLADSSARGLPMSIVVPSALLPVFALANGSPITAILSNGFALMIVLFILMPRQDGAQQLTEQVLSRPHRSSARHRADEQAGGSQVLGSGVPIRRAAASPAHQVATYTAANTTEVTNTS